MSTLNNIPPSVGLHDHTKGAQKPHESNPTSGIRFSDLLDQIAIAPSTDYYTTPKESAAHPQQQVNRPTTVEAPQNFTKASPTKREKVNADVVDEPIALVTEHNIQRDVPTEGADETQIVWMQQPSPVKQEAPTGTVRVKEKELLKTIEEAPEPIQLSMAATQVASPMAEPKQPAAAHYQDEHQDLLANPIMPTHIMQQSVGAPATEPSAEAENVSTPSIKTSIHMRSTPQQAMHEVMDIAPLPRNLVELVRSGNGEVDQPIASVEVHYPEEGLMRVQLPLSVMMHDNTPPFTPTHTATSAAIPTVTTQTMMNAGSGFQHQEAPDDHSQNHNITLQGIGGASKASSSRMGERPQATPQDKAMVQEMVERIRGLTKEHRHHVKVVLDHATYGTVTMNLSFSNQNKRVNAVFMSDNEDLLRLLQQHNDEINNVFQEAGVVCQQQHVRRV